MPRQPRIKSSSGIYHIMLRGINQQAIFEDEEDREKLIETLATYKAISGYKIFAYCLMSNHIHLLLKVEKEDIEQIIKRVAGSYVYWYNRKYYRRGHLFQDRFKSEPVEDDTYFMTVLRYIHQNPIKAKITKTMDEYKYSSYHDYAAADSEFVDIDFALAMISHENLLKFNNEKNNDICLDCDKINFRLSDIDAKKIIQKVSKCQNITEFQALETIQRDKYIKKLRKKGLSIRQISRLTGVNFSIVRKL